VGRLKIKIENPAFLLIGIAILLEIANYFYTGALVSVMLEFVIELLIGTSIGVKIVEEFTKDDLRNPFSKFMPGVTILCLLVTLGVAFFYGNTKVFYILKSLSMILAGITITLSLILPRLEKIDE